MPLAKYNSYFGGKEGSASRTLASMKEEYGDKKGTSVFYATMNKRKSAGKSAGKRFYRRKGEE